MHIKKIIVDGRQFNNGNVKGLKSAIYHGKVKSNAKVEYLLQDGRKIPVKVEVSQNGNASGYRGARGKGKAKLKRTKIRVQLWPQVTKAA